MDTATAITLGVAVLGLALSVASLTWNVVTWLHEGSRVKVEAAHAYGLGNMEPYGHMLSIKARNAGRGSTSITGWGLELPDGSHMPGHAVGMPMNTPMPHRLDGHESHTWYLIQHEIDAGLVRAGHSGAVELHPFVDLGSGKRLYGKPLKREPTS